MILEKTVFQSNPPRNKNVIWAVPEGDKIVQRIWNNGNWVPIGGSDSSSESSSGCDCNNIIIKKTFDGTLNTYVYSLEKGNFENAYAKLMSGEFFNIKIYESGYNENTGFTFMEKQDLNGFGARGNMIYMNTQNDGELVWTSDGIHSYSNEEVG